MNKYLWIFPFASFVCGYLIMNILYQSHTTQTPVLVGKSIQEAFRIAARQNLSIRMIHEQEDSELPTGTILSQNPLPGTHIKIHQSIACVVSKKTEHKAPRLTGKNLEDIQAELEKNGLTYKIHTIASTIPNNVCIAQDPAPGTSISQSPMILYVSTTYSQPFLFPDVRQKSVEEVTAFLASAPVVVHITHAQEQLETHSCNQCIVSDQRPRPGTIVYKDKQKPIQVQLVATQVVDSTTVQQ